MASFWCNYTVGFGASVVGAGGGTEKYAGLHWRLTPFKALNKRATSFGNPFHSFVVPERQRSSSQKTNGGKHTKGSLCLVWHNTISARRAELWLIPASVKEILTTEKMVLTEIQSWCFHRHPRKHKQPSCTCSAAIDLCPHKQQQVSMEREFQSSMYFTWNQRAL